MTFSKQILKSRYLRRGRFQKKRLHSVVTEPSAGFKPSYSKKVVKAAPSLQVEQNFPIIRKISCSRTSKFKRGLGRKSGVVSPGSAFSRGVFALGSNTRKSVGRFGPLSKSKSFVGKVKIETLNGASTKVVLSPPLFDFTGFARVIQRDVKNIPEANASIEVFVPLAVRQPNWGVYGALCHERSVGPRNKNFDRAHTMGGTDPGPIVEFSLFVAMISALFGSSYVVFLWSFVPGLTFLINASNWVTFFAVSGFLFTGTSVPVVYLSGLLSLFLGPALSSRFFTEDMFNRLVYMSLGNFGGRLFIPFLAWLNGFLTFPQAMVVARFISRSCIISYIFATLVLNFSGLSFYLMIILAFPGSFALAVFLVFLPLFIIVNFITILQIFALGYFLLVGDFRILEDPYFFIERFVSRYGILMRLVSAIFPILRGSWGVNLTVFTTFGLVKAALLLPLELWYNLVDTTTRVNGVYRIRYLQTRLYLAFMIFVFRLLNLFLLLKVIFFLLGVIFVLALLLVLGFYGLPVSLFPVVLFFEFFHINVFKLASYLRSPLKSFKVMYITLLQDADMFTDPFKVVNVYSNNRVKGFGVRVEPKSLSIGELDQVINVNAPNFMTGVSMFFLCLFIFILRTLTLKLVGSLRAIATIPIKLLDHILWSLSVFFIPSFTFDLFYSGFTIFLSYYPFVFKFLRSHIFRVLRFTGIVSALIPILANEVGLPDDVLPPRGGAKISKVFLVKFVQMTRKSVLRFVEGLNDFRLPEMIQAAYKPPSLDSIRGTYKLFEELGLNPLPGFTDSLEDGTESAYLAEWGSWKNWFMSSSSFSLGFRHVKLAVSDWIPVSFFPDIPGYIHSSSFTGVAEELRSTARYWSGNNKNRESSEFDDVLDGLWEGVKTQYANSKLASPETIFKGWEKKFNMGFGFGEYVRGRLRQLNRRHFINQMGGPKAFVAFWKDVFRVSQLMDMPAPVFTKMETLKLKKALSRSVRTVIGSPFGHHVLSTVFNYVPNHNYKIWETPMKIGMPLNGQNFGKLWWSLMNREKVFAGDMTAFDSTQSPPVLRLVAALRKKGFELHKDYDRICQLVDISYEKLISQPMGFKNFGDISFKGQGATTGHSSTSSDNSLMLVINYLFAWRMVTGMRSREFFNFNTLANFGDDHILAYDPVFGWNPEAAMREMAKLGTIMRDEAPGVSRLPTKNDKPAKYGKWGHEAFGFLAKNPIPVNATIKAECDAAGVTLDFDWATCHNRDRLLGKIKGIKRAKDAKNPIREYQVALSYLDLCAHHPDIYKAIIVEIYDYRIKHVHKWKAAKISPKKYPLPPSYNEVLRKWYDKDAIFTKELLIDEDVTDVDDPLVRGKLVASTETLLELTSHPDPFLMFVRWISDFPTLLSPRYVNLRWADWLQNALRLELSWPLTLVALANGIKADIPQAKFLLSKTNYTFLRSELLSVAPLPYSTLLVRHLLYTGFSRLYSRKRSFSILDFLRVFDSFFINLNWVCFGKVAPVVVELDLHLLETLVVFLLSFVHFDVSWIKPLSFSIPSPSILFAQFMTSLLGFVFPAGSIDYQPLDAKIRMFEAYPEIPFCLSAPTGVGKSTRMIKHISDVSRRRVIVIVPRHLLVVSIVTYMRELYPEVRIGGSTTGFTPDPADCIIYCTVQSFLASPNLRSPGSIFILDEAHIEEPHYIVARNYLLQESSRVIFMTATPPASLNVEMLVMPAVNAFKVQTVERVVPKISVFVDHVVAFSNDRLPVEKCLIFVPTRKIALDIASRLRCNYCLLSSKDRRIDPNAKVYISTSVSDAGLTIPDVSFVFSMQFDIHVTTPDVDENITKPEKKRTLPREKPPNYIVRASDVDSEVSFFPLSDLTITQRKGRTGRTSDGFFFLYTVVDVVTQERVYSATDFIKNLAPSSDGAFPWFPEEIKLKIDPWAIALAPYWKQPMFNFTMVSNMLKQGREKGFDTIEKMTALAVKDCGKAPPTVVSDDPDMCPIDESLIKVRGVKSAYVPVDPAPVLQPIVEEKRRHNVPGDMLLCGAYSLQGVLFTSFGVCIDVTVLSMALVNYLPPELRAANSDFFSYEHIRDFAYDTFRLRIRLIRDGNRYGLPVDYIDHRHEEALMYLDGIHYNYHGFTVPNNTIDHIPVELIFNID